MHRKGKIILLKVYSLTCLYFNLLVLCVGNIKKENVLGIIEKAKEEDAQNKRSN
jgi:hypothetical protein